MTKATKINEIIIGRTGFKISLYLLMLMLILTSVLSQTVIAREKIPLSDTADMSAFLDSDEIVQLKKDKILVGKEVYRQSFTPYMQADLPLFITSDSLLNSYHVLYEESIVRMEETNSTRLSLILKTSIKNLENIDQYIEGDKELIKKSKKRGLIFLYTALYLMEENPSLIPSEDIKTTIKEEVQRIKKAQDNLKPPWLGEPDSGFLSIDYSRYRPRGFYTRSERLSRYFQAVSWLQSIPFRVDNNEELATILIIGKSLSSHLLKEGKSPVTKREILSFVSCFTNFIGTGDQPDLSVAISIGEYHLDLTDQGVPEPTPGTLGNYRMNIISNLKADRGEINDQIRSSNDEVSIRFLSAYRTPDGVLFQKTTDPKEFNRHFPQGMEICAWLGSPLAEEIIAHEGGEKLLNKIKKLKYLLKGNSLYFQYLHTLSALIDPPEKDAPNFMKGKAWQIKSCQTVLSAWSQLRHTWNLQSKANVMYSGGCMMPPGFVEPEPEFYSRMSSLCKNTREILKDAGVLGDNPKTLAGDVRELSDKIKRNFIAPPQKKNLEEEDNEEEFDPLDDEVCQILCAGDVFENLGISQNMEPGEPLYWQEVVKKLDSWADQMEKGRMPENPLLVTAIKELSLDMDKKWEKLEYICLKLESISQKQLRQIPLNQEDEDFIRDYGVQSAKIMLYRGNSYLTPRDDAGRISDIFYNPNKGQYLHVGIGRPRAFYVLYPFNNKEIFCLGSVMPYSQFTHSQRLTDQEWMNLEKSSQGPPLLPWLKPIFSPSPNKNSE